MQRALLLVSTLLAGMALGGGATVAVLRTVESPAAQRNQTSAELTFVPTGRILAPLVFDDGSMAGYASFEVQLQVAAEDAERVTGAMPLLLHQVNLRTYRAPLASGPDGTIPKLDAFRALVVEAAGVAFGRGVVRRVAIVEARPA